MNEYKQFGVIPITLLECAVRTVVTTHSGVLTSNHTAGRHARISLRDLNRGFEAWESWAPRSQRAAAAGLPSIIPPTLPLLPKLYVLQLLVIQSVQPILTFGQRCCSLAWYLIEKVY